MKVDKKSVDHYISERWKLNEMDEVRSTRDPVKAAKTLLRLSKNGVKAIPKKELSTLLEVLCRLLVAYDGCAGCASIYTWPPR